jgi:hypothetical protein
MRAQGVVAIASRSSAHATRKPVLQAPSDFCSSAPWAWSQNRYTPARRRLARRLRSSAQSSGRYRERSPAGQRVIGDRAARPMPAVLPRHSNRVSPLVGKASIVDNPGLDRPLPLDRGQYHLAHLGQRVRPNQPPSQTKCNAIGAAPPCAKALTAAIGPTLLRLQGIIRPMQ